MAALLVTMRAAKESKSSRPRAQIHPVRRATKEKKGPLSVDLFLSSVCAFIAFRYRPKEDLHGSCRNILMCRLLGSNRFIGCVESCFAQTVEQSLEQGAHRFRIEWGITRRDIIKTKVRFDLQQFAECNFRGFMLVKMRQCRYQ